MPFYIDVDAMYIFTVSLLRARDGISQQLAISLR